MRSHGMKDMGFQFKDVFGWVKSGRIENKREKTWEKKRKKKGFLVSLVGMENWQDFGRVLVFSP